MWPLNSFPQQFFGNANPLAPQPNANFSSFNTAFAMTQAKPGATANLPWQTNAYTPIQWQDEPVKYDWAVGDDYFSGLKSVKGGEGGKVDSKDGYKPLSGSGSISGTDFKTGAGETWAPGVKAGKTYNLLSDGGVGLNGTFMANPADKNETVLGSIGLKVGDANITLSADGTLLVDGEKYKKSKNSLNGLVSEKDGTVTVKTNEGYTFTLKARGDNGIKVDIKAENVGADGIAPNGLWGAQFDGEKQTEAELRKVKARDFEISDDLSFNYEDNNALTNTETLDDETRGDQLFNGANPEGEYCFKITGNAFETYNSGQGHAKYEMNALKDGKFYNLFSDEDFQINGSFKNNKLQEVGGMIGDKKLQVKYKEGAAQPEYFLDGKPLTSQAGFTLYNNTLILKYTENGEDYQFNFGQKDGALYVDTVLWNQGGNDTRSTGLVGDAVTNGHTLDNGNDANGAGYLRNADGLLSKPGEKMGSALSEYMVDDLYDTENGRSVYE